MRADPSSRPSRSAAGLTLLAMVAALVVAFAPTPARADTVTVGTAAELAAAVVAAADGDTIQLEAGTYALDDWLIVEGRGISVVGLGIGPDATTIEAASDAGIFEVVSSEGSAASLSVRNLTLTGGSTSDGGAITASSGYDRIEVVGAVITGNTASSDGGGISLFTERADALQFDQEILISGSRIVDNTAGSWGGGVYAFGYGRLVIEDSVFHDNTAGDYGGGLYVECGLCGGPSVDGFDAELTDIVDSTFSDNVAGLGGGGAYVWGTQALTVQGSTFSGNVEGEYGGSAIYVDDWAGDDDYPPAIDDVTIVNSTFSANIALDRGALYLESGLGDVELLNTTVAGNTGGGLVTETSEVVRLRNSIVHGNGGGDCEGTMLSGGGNLDGDDSCGLTAVTDQPETDPQLATLADNGGPTQTRAITAASAAYQAASDCPVTDQRGVSRKAGACDSGAFEFVPDGPVDGFLTCPDDGPTFPDVAPESVHADNVSCGAALGLLLGTDDGRFVPAGNLTRGQAASILDRIANETNRPVPGPGASFPDVAPGNVHADAIGRLAAAGIINGFADGTFGPNVAITRAQLNSLVIRFIEEQTATVLPLGAPFPDVAADSVHSETLRKARAAGIFLGDGQGNANPNLSIRRDQAASLFVRSLGSIPIATG